MVPPIQISWCHHKELVRSFSAVMHQYMWIIYTDFLSYFILFRPKGGRDRRGGPVLTFPARSNHDRIRPEDLRRLIAYLATIPRYWQRHVHRVSVEDSCMFKLWTCTHNHMHWLTDPVPDPELIWNICTCSSCSHTHTHLITFPPCLALK